MFQDSSFELRDAYLAITVTSYFEVSAQRIHRLGTHTVQTHAFLESLGVVFATCVEQADSFDEFALRYATTIVAYAHTVIVFNGHVDAFTCIHLELVDGVIDGFLEQNVDAVFGV